MFPNATERIDVMQWRDLSQAPTPYHNISYEVGWKWVARNVGSYPALFAADEDNVARIYSQSWYIIIANFLIINNEDMVLASGVSKWLRVHTMNLCYFKVRHY